MSTFIEYISNKYKLEKTALNEDWDLFNKYSKMKKTELEKECKDNNICLGTNKNNLISNLLNKIPALERKSENTYKNKVLDNISKQTTAIEIRRNIFNNFEHKDTGFIFNSKTKCVIGKQNIDGSVSALTKEDISTCNQYNFNYDIPENLNTDLDKEVINSTEKDLDYIDETDILDCDDDSVEDDC